MTQSHADLTAKIRQAITDTAASSPNYDSDTLADVIATALDPTPPSTDPGPDLHELADGHGTIVDASGQPVDPNVQAPAEGDETAKPA